MIDVTLLGTGGTMPTATRNLTSMIIRVSDIRILVDCGEGTQIQLRKVGESLAAIDIICLTHLHADHILGLPGLLLSMDRCERSEPVLMVGPPGTRKLFENVMLFTKRLNFKVNILELNVATETEFEFGFLKIHAFPVLHSVVCYGYHFELTHAGKLNTELAESLQVPKQAWEALQRGYVVRSNGRFVRRRDICGEDRKPINIVYVTDTIKCPSIVQHSKGADLLIIECMYGTDTKGEIGSDAQDKMHLSLADVKEIVTEAHPDLVWLTHHSSSFSHVKKDVQDVLGDANIECEPFSSQLISRCLTKNMQTLNKAHFKYKD